MRSDTCCETDELENSTLPDIHCRQNLITHIHLQTKLYLFKLYLPSKFKPFFAVLIVLISF